MTCATNLCAKVVATLGSGLRSRAVVAIAVLLGVVGLVAWPLIALPAAWADSAPASAPGAGPAGISADIAPGAPTKPSISPSAPAEKTLKTGPSDQSAEDSQTPRTKVVADQVTLSIDALTPEVLHSDQDLVLSGTITNGTGQVVTGVDLVTRVQRSTEVTSLGLTKWLNGTDESGLSDPLTVPLGRDLQPGEVTQFSITVPADELPLTSADQWGPRGIAVKLESQGSSLAQDRSILVWDNGASVAPVRLTAFIPVTASAQETAVLAGPRNQERKEALTRIHSRVLGLLGMAGDDVVVAVDPALVEALGVTSASLEEAARNGGSRSSASEGAPQTPQGGDSSSPSTAEPSATAGPSPKSSAPPSPSASATATSPPTKTPDDVTQLSAALVRAIGTGSLVALPWGDSDTAALAHLQQTSLIETATQRTRESAIVKAGAPASLAWPASSITDSATVDVLPQSTSTIIASPTSLPVADELTYTPSGLGALGDRAVLLPEQSLSEALASRTPEVGTADQAQQAAPSTQSPQAAELDTRQLLRGDSAILTRQAPALERDIVVAMPRQAASSADPTALQERVDALHSTSWAQPQSLSTLEEHARAEVEAVDEGTSGIERSEPPDRVTDNDELPAATLAAAAGTASTLQSVSSVLSNPAALLGDYTDLETVVSSASWRADSATRDAQIPTAEAAGAGVTSSLAAVPSSTINLISSEAQLPVRITSSLDQKVTVQVYLVSDNKRLQVPRTTTVTVPAHQQAKVTVPIQAVGSGDVGLTVQVLAADGTTVGTPTTVHMRVRADWESRGTGIIVGILVSIVVIGTVRTVRRGRRTAVTPAAQETA
ncbi:hypothetical protein FK256_10130 [Actinomyces johnsonii]|uniref:Uncharacterized protein n=1 Tax=Actinomyces johnsonii TaxID=544581 RepID=A0A508A666_9ACTO|nr:DUF6049 family protein [Actinomyces johnsonii]KAA8740285.1 hypothetical protein F4W10_08270 [Actinomyces johnsonii]TQD42475.1 hypothetical protein FK256_10130 [Actinomyces johnsonii]